MWRYKDIFSFWSEQHFDRPGGVRSATPTAWVPGSKPIWLTELGCGAVDKGANQPNIFGDGKSAEGGLPRFSKGTPDPLMQRQYLRAHLQHWGDAAKNPVGMVDPERIYLWTWDARPYPVFPAQTEVWADGVNHATGHWLTGRLGAAGNGELAAAIAADHGAVLVAGAAGPLVGGMLLGGPTKARDALEPLFAITGQRLLARNGVLTAVLGQGAATLLDAEELAEGDGPIISRRRAAAAERPSRLALSHVDRGRDYLTASATAIRPGTGPLVTESVDMVLDGAGARLAAERLLDERAAAGDTVELALPPNLVALEPGDRIELARVAEGPFEITEIRDGLLRRVTARGLPAGDAVATGVDRAPSVPPVVAMVAQPVVTMAHLPGLPSDPARSRMIVAAYAKPWPGPVRLVDAATGASLVDLVRPAVMGEVVEGFGVGPTAVWDRGSALTIRLSGGHVADVADEAVLAGSNRLAVETDAGGWEIVGFAGAELVSVGQYRLTRLLRGLSGTNGAVVSAGRRALVLDGRVATVTVHAGRLGEARAIEVYAGANDLTGQVLTMATGTAPALPLSPVHLRARKKASGDVVLSWVRRSRADDDSWGLAEPALEHAPERYLVRIFDGTGLRRSVETDGPGMTYGLAEQVADFGAASAFSFTVAQVSPVLGAGHAGEGTFDG